MSNPTIVSRISDAVKRVFGKRGQSAEAAGSDQGAEAPATGATAPGPVGSEAGTGSGGSAVPGPAGDADSTAAGAAKEAEDIRKAAADDAAGPAEEQKDAAEDAEVSETAAAAAEEPAAKPAAKKPAAKKPAAKKTAKPAAAKPAAKPAEKKSAGKASAKKGAEKSAEAEGGREALVPPGDEAGIAEELDVAEAKTQAADPELLAEIRKGEIPGSAALAVPNYDEVSIASMRARLRKLTLAQVHELRAYEKANADREPFVKMFDNRIAKIEAENSGA